MLHHLPHFLVGPSNLPLFITEIVIGIVIYLMMIGIVHALAEHLDVFPDDWGSDGRWATASLWPLSIVVTLLILIFAVVGLAIYKLPGKTSESFRTIFSKVSLSPKEVRIKKEKLAQFDKYVASYSGSNKEEAAKYAESQMGQPRSAFM